MPSTSAKQHRFMAAVAHSPSFAKKVGVSQSVGKDFTAADKGRKFGSTSAKVGKQNTSHGAVDMPFKSLKGHTGMKTGGKVKRYEEGGDVDSLSFGKAFRQKLNELGEGKTFMWKGKKYSTNMAKPSASYRDEGRNRPAAQTEAKSTSSDTTNSGAVTGRTDKAAKNAPSAEQKERNAENLAGVTQGIAALTPIGRGVRALSSTGKAAAEAASASRAGRAATRAAEEEIGVGASGGTRAAVAKTQPPERPARNDILEQARERIIREGKERNAFEERALDTMRGEGGLKKGGQTKAMKTGGLTMRPKKDIARDQKEMAPYARGGGIESRGKTKGTVVKMAGGGFVRSADGIAQRGKTKATQVKMKKGGMC